MSRSSLSMVLLLLFAGCVQDDPVGPFKPQMAQGEGAQVVRNFVFPAPFDNNVYAGCLGENLHFTGTLVVRGYMVTTPSDLTRMHIFGMEILGGRVVGVDSGTEWTWSQFVLRNVEHVTGATHDLLMFESDFFESDSGQRMHSRNHITLLYNAQGEPTAVRLDDVVDCKLIGKD